MARKDRIEITTENSVELNNPFADLQIDNLPLGESSPPPPPAKAKSALGRVVLRRETAHRGGKIVIVIHDFAPYISNASIEDLGRTLLEQEGFRVAGVKA
jgi:translation initiation factor 1